MNDLPNELINMIMENCDYNTLLALQKVNKKMKMLAQNEVLWMNQYSSSLLHFREILRLNSTKIQPLDLNDCGLHPSEESMAKYGLSEKGWKRTFLAYLKTVNSIQTRKSQLERKAKQKYNLSMIRWGILFVFLLIVVVIVLAGGVMIPFAAEALEKGNRPNCFVFLIPPALWLDGMMKISFSIPLIPYEIVYLIQIVLLRNLLAILSSFASFLLVVLKADGIASYCWTITLIPTYLAYWLESRYVYAKNINRNF
eukprot:MONOS_11958.1-p1 / transcript=MONOS_11958.1 / gene=MONOS_11958 / organism=Monocercomonoides_exilis_PA203 / gene_product=unspecified product / transcript_product=unspecified product / location=Mono_scaffold00630:33932-35404(-) / protein_length=254 / sequence_SO=supercontig / SO=protein_coding / is_pseudo=false